MENVVALGKFIKSVVLFPPPFYFVFENSNLLYHAYKIISSNELLVVTGTIFLV